MKDLPDTMEKVLLIVDDELFNRMTLAEFCDAQKIPCMLLPGGTYAVDCFAKLIEEGKPVFKVVLLDYSMPDMNGPETAIEIVRLCSDAGLEKPTIICVTAYELESY